MVHLSAPHQKLIAVNEIVLYGGEGRGRGVARRGGEGERRGEGRGRGEMGEKGREREKGEGRGSQGTQSDGARRGFQPYCHL